MTISFNQILATIRTPGVFIEFDGSRAVQGLPSLPHVALIVAPRLSTGLVAAATPFRIGSSAEAETKFGRHSIGSFMGKAFKAANPYTEVWGIGVADAGGGVAATGTFAITGPATAAGVFYAYIAGVRIPVTVTSSMTATQLGDALVLAMADYELPVTAINTAGSVAFTARNKGTTGNKIDLRVNYNEGEALPTGIACVVTAMAAGATDGSISGAITAMADVQYHTVASAWDDDTNLDLFEAELLDRWGPMEQKEGHLFYGTKGSQGTMSTAGNLRNSFNSTLMGSGLSPTPTYVWGAVAAAVDAFQCSVDPFRPRQTLLMKGCLPPAKADILTRSERDILLSDGVSTFTVDSGGNCLLERLITTYQTTASVADPTYMDIMTVRGLAALRYTQRVRIALRFPRHKLANDGTNFGPGQAIVTPSVIRSELLALFKQWEDAGWVENFEQFRDELIVERNSTDKNRVDVRMSPDLINAFMVYGSQIQFLL